MEADQIGHKADQVVDAAYGKAGRLFGDAHAQGLSAAPPNGVQPSTGAGPAGGVVHSQADASEVALAAMTQEQLPAESPGAQPPPSGWAPAPLSDGGRPNVGDRPPPQTEHGQALGGPTLPSTKIEEFAPPRSRLPLVVALIAVVVAGLIWAGTTLRAPLPGATASASPSAQPTQTSTAAGLPFVTPDERYTGRWEILRHTWTDSGLEVEIRVMADQGPISYSFMAFGNDDVQATAAQPGSQSPQFSGMPIESGAAETGWLFFPLQRGASTILLATAAGRQMSALPVSG